MITSYAVHVVVHAFIHAFYTVPNIDLAFQKLCVMLASLRTWQNGFPNTWLEKTGGKAMQLCDLWKKQGVRSPMTKSIKCVLLTGQKQSFILDTLL